ncbi:MAG: TerB family tellurite resistance protein [Sphingobacteriales bacterium]|nr:MAG: TerB family tellurite resistance protein [Sphingobacteriales bacterium]
MKVVIITLFLAIGLVKPGEVRAQAQEAQQLLLNLEKLAQLKSILKNMYEGYQVVSKGYNTIKNISQGNYKLHQAFFDRLLEVSPAVRKYKRVADIISYQKRIMQEHKKAFNYFKGTGSFTLEEINYMEKVYSNLFQQSVKSLDDLLMVITASRLRMSDDERLEAIDRIFVDMQGKLTFLRSFNNSTKLLAVQRIKEQHEIDLSKKLNEVK